MRVLLLDVDSKLPNLALAKIAMWHRAQDDEVTRDTMHFYSADRIYGSCLLSRNRPARSLRRYRNPDQLSVEDYNSLRRDITWGGTGYDPKVKLPPEVERLKARINYGFTTRGCIRRCPWCLVPESEGKIRYEGDIYDLWDGRSDSVTLLDNNILALNGHWQSIFAQLERENLKVDFNQGLDIRLIDGRTVAALKRLRMRRLRLAFDEPELEHIIRAKVPLLQTVKRDLFFYVLVGFNTTVDEDIHRLNVLRDLGCRAYVMRHDNTPRERVYMRMAQWANQVWTFRKYTFGEFLKIREGQNDGD